MDRHGGMTTDAIQQARSSASLEVLRDITRGGLSGLIVGVLLAGIGGRAAMRLAAILVPSADGAFTENGNRIGDITLGGSLGIIIVVGLLFGAVAGSLWVVIRPWLPRSRPWAAIATVPIAIALGTLGLVEARNDDFEVLGHDPLVVTSLVVLVAAFGPALVLVDGWLDRRLPRPGPADRTVIGRFTLVTFLGLALTILFVVPMYLGSPLRLAGVALVVVGLATLTTWKLRGQGRQERPVWLTTLARGALIVAVVAGMAVVIPEVQGALG